MSFPAFSHLKQQEGYSITLDQVIPNEFKRCDSETYVDHAASTLYSASQLKSIFDCLASNLYGNPHSGHGPSDTMTQVIDAARQRILKHFHTDSSKYSVIFTSGASAAIKIVNDSFQWTNRENSSKGALVYTKENHTSCIGVREGAFKALSEVHPVYIKDIARILGTKANVGLNSKVAQGNGLFVYSAQCNYSGAKYPLSWIEAVHTGQLDQIACQNNAKGNHQWYVLLDAAGLVATCPLDLDTYSPDFVPVSFYKLFGYPTGLGCLLVSKRGEVALERNYFGGGTISMVDVGTPAVHRRKVFHERFEDGTLPFLDILSLEQGFRTLHRITGGMEHISTHVFNVARYFHHNLRSLRHSNNKPVAVIYNESHHWSINTHGSIVNFNILNEHGKHVGYSQVDRFSSIHNIYLRTGCVCNPGACERYLEITAEEKLKQFDSGHVCGDAMDLVDGHPTGSVRVSFGYMSLYKDADKVLKMITECFVQQPLMINTDWLHDKSTIAYTKRTSASQTNSVQKEISASAPNLTLTDILVYPVKSCGAMSVKRWAIGTTGFEYDRQWMVVLSTGIVLTLKRVPQLSQITPLIDLNQNVLVLDSPGFCCVKVSLDRDADADQVESNLCSVKVCGDRVQTSDCGNDVAQWLSHVLSIKDVRLVRQVKARNDHLQKNGKHQNNLSLANESQFLVIHRPSIRTLLQTIEASMTEQQIDEEDLMLRFRANLVLDGGTCFEEDRWTAKTLVVDGHQFKIEALCTRCQMVCVSPKTGIKTNEPLLSLAKIRGSSVKFGVHAFHKPNGIPNATLCVGAHVQIL